MENYQTFSDRMGFRKVLRTPQIDGIDEALRTGFYNQIHISWFEPIPSTARTAMEKMNEELYTRVFKKIWSDWFDQPLDTFPYPRSVMEEFIKPFVLYTDEWYKIYDFLEFLIRDVGNNADREFFGKCLQRLLNKHNAGYSLLNGHFTPITDPEQLKEIANLEINFSRIQMQEIRTHLNDSLQFLALKPEPNIRNSIKESISMVEAVARKMSHEQTLGQALSNLKNEGKISPLLAAGFDKLYAFTNGTEGMRHSISHPLEKESTLDLATGRFFLVACSAFTNYLIEKGIASGDLAPKS